MGNRWTSEQRQVIDLRNRNLLVSAAAGSGKTAVLVERIISKITDSNSPLDIDKLLIVTFTNAAAAEMRERIGLAIESALEKQPDNVHLQRQQTLLHNAQITTIHSFCLYVIRNYFHRIDMEPDFRMAEEGELKLLRSDVLDRVLERYYKEAKPEFLTLSETLATGKNDMMLKETVLRLFDFAMSNPWVEEWLEQCRDIYHITGMEDFNKSPMAEELTEYLKCITGQWAMQARLCADISMEEDGPVMYAELLDREAEAMRKIEDSSTYEQYYEKIKGFSFGRLPAARKYTGDEEKKERVKNLRNEVKASMKKMTEQFFYQSPEMMIADIRSIRPVADMLIEVTLTFIHAFAEKKQEKNILDFNDLEHFALKILVDDKTRQPTETAKELQKKYEEIMIDEYQDSNYVQEAVLKAVSKESGGTYNVFMVGDVKQSIYRFRMARPELFMEKYNTYDKDDGVKQRIDLHKNFRSRKEVIRTVNDMFRRIMREDIGNITYDAQAALYPGAEYPEDYGGTKQDGFQTRFLVIDSDNGEVKTPELEARAIGHEIKQMMEMQMVTDKETGELRRICYSDIVILLRSLSGWSDYFVKTLSEMGIPVRAATGTGYFSAIEVQTALNLLSIVDNPRQDIPMAAVLASPIVGLSGDDMAVIRTSYPKKPFYQAVMDYMEMDMGERSKENEPEKTNIRIGETGKKKLRDFFSLLMKYRKKVCYTPIHELLFQLLEETGYLAYVYALPGGEVKRANLEMLIEKAIAYEKTSYRGLFHFIRYMEQLRKYDVDFASAESGEAEDIVRIMSIHKSKGLEFPVVFVSGLGKKYNSQDTREKVVFHPRLGIGMDVADIRRRIRIPGLTRQFLARKITLENVGEEMRVLYVALTRAKEKLIFTGVMKNAEEKIDKINAVAEEDGFLTFLSRLNASSFLQLLLLARSFSKEAYPLTIIRQTELEESEEQAVMEEELTRVQLLARLQETNPEWEKKIQERMSYVYPYEDEISMKTKLTVSELKRRVMERMDMEQADLSIFVSGMLEDERNDADYEADKRTGGGEAEQIQGETESYIPAFMRDIQEEDTGAKRGTALHRVLECYDFTKSPDTLRKQLEDMIEEKRINEDIRKQIYLPSLAKFLRTSLGKRMQNAAKQGKLRREKPFVMGKAAKDVLEESDSGEMILIQGIIDVFFEEPDGIVLLDYKTDRVKTKKELLDRYDIQLKLYQEAIERATGKKVKERILYSFCLGESIAV